MNTQKNAITIWSGSYWASLIVSDKPGLLIVAVEYGILASAVGFLIFSEPLWRVLGIGQDSRSLFGSKLVLGFLSLMWPVSAAISYVLAYLWRFRAPFIKVLHTTGKAWVLQGVVALAGLAFTVALALGGWASLAKLWLVLWPFLCNVIWWAYPAALKGAYSVSVRSGLITFLTFVLWLLLFIGIIWLTYATSN